MRWEPPLLSDCLPQTLQLLPFLLDLYGIHLALAVNVGPEHQPFSIRRKRGIRFQSIIVFRQVHEFLGLEQTVAGCEQINPLTVPGRSDTVWSAAITGK